MDLERLTKHQIILLTLLVSFVTSIATGIVTVSLINQAPAGVTRTINQIVERTVEKVVPASQGAAVGVEKTVVVKDDDLAAQSIAAVQKAIVRIVPRGGGTDLVARGVIVNSKGMVLSDRTALAAYGTENFEAILSSGERVRATLVSSSDATAILELRLGTTTLAPATIGDPSALKLGQSVIRIGGSGTDTVGVGVIASLPSSGYIQASVVSTTAGSVLINLFGEVIGLTTGDSQGQGSDFYSIPSNVSPGT